MESNNRALFSEAVNSNDSSVAPFNIRSEGSPHDSIQIQFTEEQSVHQTSSFPNFNYSTAGTLSMMSYNMMASASWPQHNVPVNQPAMQITAGLDMQPQTSNIAPYSYMGIPAENMYAYNYGGMYGGMPAQENMFLPPIKQVINLTKGVLYPPNPNSPRPTTRERPLGCKTVFVGGLPEKITEEIIREIFERCGTVETIRMSKKNFCHIRFSDELYVDNALYFSGYRLKIENKDELEYTGRLHVDYAQARDDQYDYECKQRALQRQARHQEQDYFRPPTPPVVHYTDHEASLICEKLKNEETFTQAASILITWLEKGECTKKNSSTFFSMIQSTYNHVRKLQIDKNKYEEQLNEAKKMLKKQLEGIIRQFTEIGKIYKAASLQKCWDMFTKAQRKNIDMWKKQTEELKNAHMEEVINEREDAEMELSDDEDTNKKDIDVEQLKSQHKEHIQKLQEENDSLKCQLDAAKSNLMIMKSDQKEENECQDSELAEMQEELKKSKKDLSNLRQQRAKYEVELIELRAYKRRMIEEDSDDSAYEENSPLGDLINVNEEKETLFISIISTFLHTHPMGASIDYICSYLSQFDSTVRSRDVEIFLKKYPKIFTENSTGVGATLGKKWFFVGFTTPTV